MAEIEGVAAYPFRDEAYVDGYVVRMTVARIDGRPSVVGIEMWGMDPDSPEIPPSCRDRSERYMGWPKDKEPKEITSEAIRLPLKRMFDEYREHSLNVARWVKRQNDVPPTWQQAADDDLRTLDPSTSDRGRPRKWSDDHYREVAKVYREAVSNRWPVAKSVAVRWELPLPEGLAQAKKWIQSARQRGFLPPTTRGRVSIAR